MKLLTEREEEIAMLIFLGKSNKEIAEVLFISIDTVKTHIQKAFEKTQSKSRTDLSRAWLECTFNVQFRRSPSDNKLKIIRNLNTTKHGEERNYNCLQS
ncbi:response regulator transcription factor [Carboxylicivirga sediminis]|uniref:Response regulator transcription factor n=1 Tax=Carboxylicivirga sediminis TaxID=2006564 RepID=A0A941F574_9BACT|nr:LuxR C-terminal-related transcriptional regulator [Carboxylicivirga sediminis]MBR8535445.1 response regulator transcription factor [Carboxylicivirga sediminis]